MAKDPAFLFYPNDWIGGTMGMSFEEKGAYMELLMMQFNRGHMTKHMMGQVVGQLLDRVLDKFTQDEEGLYYNERLETEKNKRNAFINSRLNNKSGKNQFSKKEEKEGHMSNHMVNENVNSSLNVFNRNFEKNEFQVVYEKMMAVYLLSFPTYFRDEFQDYSACVSISQKTEKLKGWLNGSSLNGKMDDFMAFWTEIVQYVSGDKWLSSRSLKDLSDKEWQRLGQHMRNVENGTSSKDQRSKKNAKVVGVEFINDFTQCRMSDDSVVDLDENQQPMARFKQINPSSIKR